MSALLEPNEPPFFPEPSTSRPPIPQTGSSDSSITTVSSMASETSASSYSSSDSYASLLDNPYSQLVVVEPSRSFSRSPMSSPNLTPGGLSSSSSWSDPERSRSSSFASSVDSGDRDRDYIRASLASSSEKWSIPQSGGAAASSSSSTSLHQIPSLARLSLDIPSDSSRQPLHSSTYPGSSAPIYLPSETMIRPRSAAQQHQHRPSSAGTGSTSTSVSTTASRNSASSFGSMGLGSSHSSMRPWVRDSDASSICSRGSGSPGSNAAGASGSGGRMSSPCMCDDPDHHPDGEVFKIDGGKDEFLDPRPEPSDARMTINRDDPTYVIVNVTLPHFSVENITVAMRRGHKVHIVADSYGDDGGHFEKLVSLSGVVSSIAPRAHFDGTTLQVFVLRRQPRPVTRSNSSRSGSNNSSTASSIAASAVASTTTLASSAPSTIRRTDSSSEEAPVVTRTTAVGTRPRGAGPEAARAAAKKAKEEAAQRAKEEAKILPKIGRKIAFTTALLSRMTSSGNLKEAASSSSSSSNSGGSDESGGSGSSAPSSVDSSTDSLPPVPPVPSGLVTGSLRGKDVPLSLNTSTFAAMPPTSGSSRAREMSSRSSNSSTSTSKIGRGPSASSTTLVPPMHDEDTAQSPTRPKLRSNDLNLTLRPNDGTSFVQAAAAAAAASRENSPCSEEGGSTADDEDEDGEPDRRSDTGSVTPRVERPAMTLFTST